MSRQFQRWAGRNPITRPIATRQTAQVFDLVAGFVYSQILYACVQAELFDRLAEGPKHQHHLAAELGLSHDAIEVLLEAATALDLIEERGPGLYGLGALGAPLVKNEPVLSMIRHHRALYADLVDPLALLRQRRFDTHLARFWPYQAMLETEDQTNREVAARYSDLMGVSQPLVSDEVLQVVDFAGVKTLLDVGGGEGRFIIRLAQKLPDAQLSLFDLPPVAERAAKLVAQAGFAHRVTCHGGSFHEQGLPAAGPNHASGYDMITLIRVAHDHDDPQLVVLLKSIFASLAPGGRLILAEPMAQTPGAKRMGHAYFGFYLWAMGRGRSRSAERLVKLLKQAGFSTVEELASSIPLHGRVLQAAKGC